MSIMFAGVDKALKNMDAERHSDIVDAIESGDAEKAAASVESIWRAPQQFWLPEKGREPLHDNPLQPLGTGRGNTCCITAPRHCQT